MPLINKKAKILTEIMNGTINNHIAVHLKVSRQYITQMRKKYQNENVKTLLATISVGKTRFHPLEYIDYKWLIDAKLIKVMGIDFLKNKSVHITPLGSKWLDFLQAPDSILNAQSLCENENPDLGVSINNV